MATISLGHAWFLFAATVSALEQCSLSGSHLAVGLGYDCLPALLIVVDFVSPVCLAQQFHCGFSFKSNVGTFQQRSIAVAFLLEIPFILFYFKNNNVNSWIWIVDIDLWWCQCKQGGGKTKVWPFEWVICELQLSDFGGNFWGQWQAGCRFGGWWFSEPVDPLKWSVNYKQTV